MSKRDRQRHISERHKRYFLSRISSETILNQLHMLGIKLDWHHTQKTNECAALSPPHVTPSYVTRWRWWQRAGDGSVDADGGCDKDNDGRVSGDSGGGSTQGVWWSDTHNQCDAVTMSSTRVATGRGFDARVTHHRRNLSWRSSTNGRVATKATAVRADGSGYGSQPISCRATALSPGVGGVELSLWRCAVGWAEVRDARSV